MSFDRQIDQVCPHEVREEPLLFFSDRRTLLPLRPIAAASSVLLRLNGEIDVPATGVHVPASTRGRKTGPFRVTSTTGRLDLSVHGGPIQSVTVPPSTRMTVDQLVNFLTPLFAGVSFSNDRGALAMASTLTGEDATLYVLASSTLAALVGFTADREYRGKTVVPAWSIVQRPGTVDIRPGRAIIFDTPLKGYQDYAEISYTTVREECRRCGGVGVESDWRYGVDGNTVEVRDEALLLQEVQKVTFTARSSNPFHLWYGSTLLDRIGAQVGASGVIQNIILSDIQTTFTRWQNVKKQQEATGQFISDEEFPSRIQTMNVEQSQTDPTVYFINVTVVNRSNSPIQISRGVRLPQPTNLLGESAAQGVYRQSLSNYTLVG